MKSALSMPLLVLPARSEQLPEATWTALPSAAPVLTFLGKARVQAASRPEPPSLAEKLLLTALTYQPLRPLGAAGVAPLSLIVGLVTSIMKSALSMPLLVLPARSEQLPEATWTALPSAAPVLTFLGKARVQAASRPEPPSLAEKLLLTALTYQPLRPLGAA